MSTSPQYVSISEAATRLGVKPWDVVRLIETGRLETTQLVAVTSLDNLQKQGATR